jgi:hypothetical protein
MAKAYHWMIIFPHWRLPDYCCVLSARCLDYCAQIPGPITLLTPKRERRTLMSAPRDSRCRYKECYNCKHRTNSIIGGQPEYGCGLAVDGTIRVFECGGFRYYLPTTKAQRREQHELLMEY